MSRLCTMQDGEPPQSLCTACGSASSVQTACESLVNEWPFHFIVSLILSKEGSDRAPMTMC